MSNSSTPIRVASFPFHRPRARTRRPPRGVAATGRTRALPFFLLYSLSFIVTLFRGTSFPSVPHPWKGRGTRSRRPPRGVAATGRTRFRAVPHPWKGWGTRSSRPPPPPRREWGTRFRALGPICDCRFRYSPFTIRHSSRRVRYMFAMSQIWVDTGFAIC